MDIKYKIKSFLMLKAMEWKRKKEPFDGVAADKFQLPANAGPMINNSYFFGANSADGRSLIMRLGHRNTGFDEVFVIYITPDGQFYGTEKQQYIAKECPLKVECLVPEKVFMVSFNGQLNDMKTHELVLCNFRFFFEASLPIFDAMQHSDFRGMAQAYARAKWNRAFFKTVGGDTGMKSKKNTATSSQRHYEQTGTISGHLQIGNEKEIRLNMPATRDHAFGRRDWNFMNDHIWLVGETEKGEAFNFSLVNYPQVKGVFCGYADIGSDKNQALIGFELKEWDFNDGKGPEVMKVDCHFIDGRTLTITATRKYDLYLSFDNGNYYFHEGVGDFNINGVKARGSIEYGFNKDHTRWDAFTNV